MSLFIFKMQLAFNARVRELKENNVLPDQKLFNIHSITRPLVNPNPLWLFILEPLIIGIFSISFGFIFLAGAINSILTGFGSLFIRPYKGFEKLAKALIDAGFSLFSFIMSPINMLIWSVHVVACIIKAGSNTMEGPELDFATPYYMDDVLDKKKANELIEVIYLKKLKVQPTLNQRFNTKPPESASPQNPINIGFFPLNENQSILTLSADTNTYAPAP